MPVGGDKALPFQVSYATMEWFLTFTSRATRPMQPTTIKGIEEMMIHLKAKVQFTEHCQGRAHREPHQIKPPP